MCWSKWKWQPFFWTGSMYIKNRSQSDTFLKKRHDRTLLLTYFLLSPHSNSSSYMREELERGGTLSACSLGGAAFLPVVLGILSELMITNVQTDFNQLMSFLLEVFQYHNDPKHTANASEIIFGENNGLLNTASQGLASTDSRPEYYRGSMGSPGQRKK